MQRDASFATANETCCLELQNVLMSRGCDIVLETSGLSPETNRGIYNVSHGLDVMVRRSFNHYNTKDDAVQPVLDDVGSCS
jgi:hypothetical protein